MIENIGAYSQVDYDRGYQQGRADVLREHREQCQGKCFKCEVSVPFINSDGEEVILPYSYSYKTDCEDNRYINAKEVLSLINRTRADAIDELFNKKVFNNNTESLFDLSLKECRNDFDDGWNRCYHDFEEIAEQLKEQK